MDEKVDEKTKKLALFQSPEASEIARLITAFTKRISELSCFAKFESNNRNFDALDVRFDTKRMKSKG